MVNREVFMTEFKLYNIDESELYANKTDEEKEKIRYDMVMMALEKGIKPAARRYNTYPSTVRTWVKRYKEQGIDALKNKK